MKKSKLFGTRIINNIQVPRTPNVIMFDSSDSLNTHYLEEGDIFDAPTIKKILQRLKIEGGGMTPEQLEAFNKQLAKLKQDVNQNTDKLKDVYTKEEVTRLTENFQHYYNNNVLIFDKQIPKYPDDADIRGDMLENDIYIDDIDPSQAQMIYVADIKQFVVFLYDGYFTSWFDLIKYPPSISYNAAYSDDKLYYNISEKILYKMTNGVLSPVTSSVVDDDKYADKLIVFDGIAPDNLPITDEEYDDDNGYILYSHIKNRFIITDQDKEKGYTKWDKFDTYGPQDYYDLLENILYYDCANRILYAYDYDTKNLVKISSSGSEDTTGIPILSKDMLQNAPDKYIMIPDTTQLDGDTNIQVVKTVNGTYLDILFQSLRALQAEVAKLRNSFRYGINSYTDTNTALSTVVGGYDHTNEDEPLWAVEESDLSEIDPMQTLLTKEHKFKPTDAVDTSKDGILKFNDGVYWEADAVYHDNKDSKQFIYLTASKAKNITLTLINPDDDTDILKVDLSKVVDIVTELYDILIVISRKKDNGHNFVWLTIDDHNSQKNLVEGYYKDGKLYSSLQELKSAYDIKQINAGDMTLSKFNIYSRYQDFSKEVIPSKPSDDTYKYSTAHITIRSVKNKDVLTSIQHQLLNNELIWVEQDRKLWIKTNDKVVSIGGNSITPGEEGMTEQQMIDKLKQLGIVKEENGLELNDVSNITFVHNETNKKFKFGVNAYGELKSQEINNTTFESRLKDKEITKHVRGIVGQLGILENNENPSNIQIKVTGNAGLNSDRLRIGALYCPLSTDNVFGCSHGFIELENTSDKDINLKGCYLHYARLASDGYKVNHLALTGTIPAGGTYLIRCKKYAEFLDANTFIKVTDYDQEWYDNGELLDMTVQSGGMAFAVTYGEPDLAYNKYLYSVTSESDENTLGIKASNAKYIYEPYFIDSISIYKNIVDNVSVGFWCPSTYIPLSNSIVKNTFELEPAQQGYQALNKYDSSRQRWASSTDTQVLTLDKEYIEFPHSSAKYPVSNFTPRASYQHKNVCTDKSKLDPNKPNMVTCSFGINVYTTRCFNWISVGSFDEYVFIKQGSGWKAIESYKHVDQILPNGDNNYPHLHNFDSVNVVNNIYARIVSRFPADGTQFTAHKCIIDVVGVPVSDTTKYTYVVGRADKNGNPDFEHCSEEFTFTLHPTTHKPKVYQITDQQGFNWVEYQVWAATADIIDAEIIKDTNVIPVLINTGDMTQNGTRINEWYDYYQAGKKLFKHLEQMNVVGNNDLCGSNVTELGTGDDFGKSNSYYFHVFYCYEVPEAKYAENTMQVNGKYIPSLYYFDFQDYRFCMINSEITQENCANWFNLKDGDTPINIYTGYTIPQKADDESKFIETFTPIYKIVWDMFDTNKKIVAACHEMPFTVITNDSLTTGQKGVYRSVSPKNALVGSHLNQITPYDKKGLYWFSRLLEFKKIKLCIGGHKHTYACTYPVREYFLFGNGKNSKDNFNEYTMTDTLKNDNVTWVQGDDNLTKLPLVKRTESGTPSVNYFFPYTADPSLEGGVVYFMCQASGYKLKSNKELPSSSQKYSCVIPKTDVKAGVDKPDKNQQYPMYATIDCGDTFNIQLVRLANIFNNKLVFNQNEHATDPIHKEYLVQVSENNYGKWQSEQANLITV